MPISGEGTLHSSDLAMKMTTLLRAHGWSQHQAREPITLRSQRQPFLVAGYLRALPILGQRRQDS